MLIFADAMLTYLATPKTGSTAVEMALRPKADVIFAKQRKHMPAERFKTKLAPFLQDAYGIRTEVVAVMRDPIDQMRSWYKYRSRDEISGAPRSTRGMSFDDFILAAASERPPECARIGSQYAFLTDGSNGLLIDHLFSYANQPEFLEFLSERLGTAVALKRKNVSPEIPAPLSEKAASVFRSARTKEFDLYDRLTASGGYLGPR